MKQLRNVSFSLLLICLYLISFSSDIRYNYSGNVFFSDFIIDSIFNLSSDPINDIMHIYCDNGYVYASVNIDSVFESGNYTDIYCSISENKRYRIKGFMNKGNIQSGLINSMFKYKGYYFSDSLIQYSITDIYGKMNIESNSDYGIMAENDSLLIMTYISDNRQSVLNALIASGIDDRQVYGYFNAELYSPQGYARIYKLNYIRAADGLSGLKLFLSFPYFFGFPFTMNAQGKYEDYDSITTKAGFNTEFIYYKGNVNISLGMGREWIFTRNDSLDDIYYTILSMGLNVADYSPLSYGFQHFHYHGIDDYGRTELYIKYMHRYSNIFADAGVFADMLAYSDSISEYTLRRTGGSTSIRGLEENSILYSSILRSTLSIGYIFSPMFHFSVFTDNGIYTRDGLQTIAEENIITYGIGFDIFTSNTKTGIFLALPLQTGFNSSRLHILFQYRF